MDKLKLAWETYEFYTNEIYKYEEIHINTLKTLKRFVNENLNPKKYQRTRVRNKCKESCEKITLLYYKQIQSIDELIAIYEDCVDIPPEYYTEVGYLLTLKNITSTLMNEINQYKIHIENMLD